MFHYHLALSQLFPSGFAALRGFLSCHRVKSIPERWLSTACFHMPGNGLSGLLGLYTCHLLVTSIKYYNEAPCLRLRVVTFQNAARISPRSRVYDTGVSFILLVLQNTEGWTVTSRLPPFNLLPQNHMQVLVLDYQHLSSLPDVSSLRTERRMPWRVWHIAGTY